MFRFASATAVRFSAACWIHDPLGKLGRRRPCALLETLAASADAIGSQCRTAVCRQLAPSHQIRNPGRSLARCPRGLLSANLPHSPSGCRTDRAPSCRNATSFPAAPNIIPKSSRRPFSQTRQWPGGTSRSRCLDTSFAQTPWPRESPSADSAFAPAAEAFHQARETDRHSPVTDTARRSPSGSRHRAKTSARPWTSSRRKRANRHCSPTLFDPKKPEPQPRWSKADRGSRPDRSIGARQMRRPLAQAVCERLGAAWAHCRHKETEASCCRRMRDQAPKRRSIMRARCRSTGFCQLGPYSLYPPARGADRNRPPPRTSNAISRCGSQVAQNGCRWRHRAEKLSLIRDRGELFRRHRAPEAHRRPSPSSSARLRWPVLPTLGQGSRFIVWTSFARPERFTPASPAASSSARMPRTVLSEPARDFAARRCHAARQVPLQEIAAPWRPQRPATAA